MIDRIVNTTSNATSIRTHSMSPGAIGEPPSSVVVSVIAAISAGILSEGVIDNALIHLFTIRMETGEFDPPSSVPYTSITKSAIQSPAHQTLATTVADNSLVLLKNGNVSGTSAPLLPASASKLNNVVILGDMADTVTLGDYSGAPSLQVNAVQGITNAIHAVNPNANITFDAAGTSSTATSAATLSAATQSAIKNADLVILFVGTNQNNAQEGMDRTTIAMPGNYEEGTELVINFTLPLGEVNLGGEEKEIIEHTPFGDRKKKQVIPVRPFDPITAKALLVKKAPGARNGMLMFGTRFVDVDAFVREEIARFVHAFQVAKLRKAAATQG